MFSQFTIETLSSSSFLSFIGHLLIQQARMEDTGNYTCVASNGVITRKSQEAEVTIYVPGSWGTWETGQNVTQNVAGA